MPRLTHRIARCMLVLVATALLAACGDPDRPDPPPDVPDPARQERVA